MKKIVTLAMLFTVLITVAQKVKIQKLDKIIKGLRDGDVWDELLQLGLRFAKP